MREYGFSLIHVLPYKGRIVDSVLMLENTDQWKPVFSHVLCSKIVDFQSKLWKENQGNLIILEIISTGSGYF